MKHFRPHYKLSKRQGARDNEGHPVGCDAVGRECLIVSNGWKYFTLKYGRKRGENKAEMHNMGTECSISVRE